MKLLAISLLSGSLFLGSATAPLAADLISDAPAPVVDTAPSNWTGFYAGLYGLGGAGVVTDTYDLVTPFTFGIAGPGVGVEAGANMQTGNLVLGIRGDIAGARITGTGTCSPLTCLGSGTNPTVTVDAVASLTAQFGYALDTWLLYGNAGISIAHATASDPVQGGSDNQWHSGLVGGVGVEKQLGTNLSFFGEADFAAYQGVNYALVFTPDRIAFNLTTVRLGVKYHF
jgi:opacity protein-like surface antigen